MTEEKVIFGNEAEATAFMDGYRRGMKEGADEVDCVSYECTNGQWCIKLRRALDSNAQSVV